MTFPFAKSLPPMIVFTLSLALSAFCSVEAGAEPATDFDGDGFSDLTFVTTRRSDSLLWKARSSATGSLSKVGTFGSRGDIPVPARWTDQGTTQLAVVNQGESALRWYLSGVENPIELGTTTSIVVGGADFDGSGFADAAVVTSSEGALLWQVHTDPFMGGTASDPFAFGSDGDTPFFASVDGIHDWFGVISSASPPVVTLRDPATSEERSATLPARMQGLAPLPARGEDGIDLLAFAKVRSVDTTVWFFNLAGERVRRVRTPGTGTAIVGDYLVDVPGEEVAITGTRSYNIASSLIRSSSSFLVKRPKDSVSGVTVQGFAAGGGGDQTDDPGLGGCQTLDPYDGSGVGFVWKPNSDTTYYAVAVMPGTLNRRINKVEVYSGAGALIKELTYSGCGNPDPNGPRCNYKDYALTGANYRRRYTSIILKLSLKAGGCGTYYVADPSQRLD